MQSERSIRVGDVLIKITAEPGEYCKDDGYIVGKVFVKWTPLYGVGTSDTHSTLIECHEDYEDEDSGIYEAGAVILTDILLSLLSTNLDGHKLTDFLIRAFPDDCWEIGVASSTALRDACRRE